MGDYSDARQAQFRIEQLTADLAAARDDLCREIAFLKDDLGHSYDYIGARLVIDPRDVELMHRHGRAIRGRTTEA